MRCMLLLIQDHTPGSPDRSMMQHAVDFAVLHAQFVTQLPIKLWSMYELDHTISANCWSIVLV